ncbi:Alpha-ketoglutaric semialdehyde dehydrogenase [Pigmentiphaga humi]|uniref:Alpha-ketoglutaric semialdehyde dehydrogenase n=1 Tax=Pigmentiphaga humi TaxID=2478468 RepID=A0A3P4B4U7_9BURK|nr:NAD-dependent succinate-semialdehyde dehydrogenase [Pigmentiphaga humi]VCU70951.1 Alpha-ketoglutaric semialdehyde dehydrogenase [Pigmentiphaga humi]
MYPDTRLFIDGQWRAGGNGELPVYDPATEARIGSVAHAGPADLDDALAAAARAFDTWRAVPAPERARRLHAVADHLRGQADRIARIITCEEGKPLDQALHECASSAEVFDWCAEEARRLYGRTIPARVPDVLQIVEREPVGPVAAFTPWNFPLSQVARKVAAALAAGCSVVLKAAEDTPATAACLMRAIEAAGLPAGVANLVFGNPAEISARLIASPAIRKVSFTGSTAVGRQLAELAGRHMKPITAELGGHAPAIVFDDADLDRAIPLLAAAKYRNAGQICISPTRFLVQEGIYDDFVARFASQADAIRLGHGLESGTGMGPLIHERRVRAAEAFVADALERGAQLRAGGERPGGKGWFYRPTVLAGLPADARIMNEEPFAPIAAITPFRDDRDAIAEANRLPYGLAAYAYTRSMARAALAARAIEAGMVSINHQGLGPIEAPFGGVKDSGHGREGGTEAVDAYLVTKYVTHFTQRL